MIRKFSRDERGIAMASVVLLGAFLLMLSVVMMARSMSTSNFVAGDRAFDQAVHVAESSIDFVLAEFAATPTFHTGQVLTAVDTHDEVLAEALALAHDPASPYYAQAVHETGEGLSVIVKPFDALVVYGVGFTPSLAAYDAGRGKARIVVSELAPPYWQPEQAVLIGGPGKIEAKKKDKHIDLTCSAGAPAGCDDAGGWIHLNGEVEWKTDKNQDNITGCLTAYGAPDTVTKKDGKDRKDPDKTEGPYTNDDDSAYPLCPEIAAQDGPPAVTTNPTRSVPYIAIPEIDPLVIHYLAFYDVCLDGMRWGPNGANSPYWPGGATTVSLSGIPCTGDFITSPVIGNWVLGLKNADKGDKPGYEKWDKKVEFDKNTEDGIFFLWGRSAKVKKTKNEGDRYWTIIGAKGESRDKVTHAPLFNDLTCLGKDEVEVWNPKDLKWEGIKKEHYGDIEIEVEHDDIYPYGWTGDNENPGEGKGYLAVTSGDIKAKIKGKKSETDPGEIFGMLAAHEQVKIESNDADESKGAFYGAIVAEDVCDTPDSKHKDKISEFKKGDIIYDGKFKSTDFLLEYVLDGEYRIVTTEEF